MCKKLLIMTLALVALLGLATVCASAASGENIDTLYVGTGQTFDTLDAVLNYAAKTRSADPVEIVLQSDTTMNTTARAVPQNLTIKSDEGGPYTVTNTADFVVDGGHNLTLENVNFTSSDGRAFQVNSGTLIANDAVTLAGNRIVVASGGTATLNNGTTITGNTATTGGGVYVSSGGTFNMYGGTISNNSVTTSVAYGGGGGVYVYNSGTFNMYGGAITGNTTTTDGGGGVYVYNGSTFNMYGGTISGNTATRVGGGVLVAIGGTFNMSGGTITGNTANTGGGVQAHGTFNMSGGDITRNTASTAGGGVYTLYTVSSKFNLSGIPVVKNNKLSNGSVSNIDRTAGNIAVIAPLEPGADVWVTNPAAEGAVFATANSVETAALSAPYFRNDVNPLTGVSNGGTSLSWGKIVAELVKDSIVHSRYTTLDEAINIYSDSATQMILLAADITTPATVDKTIYLDLNGHSITGPLTINADCTLCGLDSTSDDYKGNGTGKISGTITGTVAPYTDTKAEHTTKEKHYITVTEGNEVSFHRYNVQVSDYYFRLVYDENNTSDTDIAMMNFGATVQGDSHVAEAITNLELSSSLNGGTEDKTTVPPLTDLKAALQSGSDPYYHRSHFIYPGNPYTAQYALKVRLTLNIGNNQTATTSAVRNYSLVDILKIFYESATDDQKTVIDTFLQRNGLQPLP